MHRWSAAQGWRSSRVIVLGLLLAVSSALWAGCSSGGGQLETPEQDAGATAGTESSDGDAASGPARSASEPSAVVSDTRTDQPDGGETTVGTETSADAPTTTAIALDPGPVVRPAENTGVDAGTHWIGHGAMTENEVELVWSEVAGDDVVYRIHRFETRGGTDPASLDTSVSEPIVVETDTLTHVDTTMAPDTFHTYVLEVVADGVALPLRWTEVLTVTDTTPPTPVHGLLAERTPDGVLLSWEPSSDDIEFAAYSVSLVVDGESAYLGGGADLGQVSFLDTRPPSSEAVYEVVAVDFHDNRSTPAVVAVPAG